LVVDEMLKMRYKNFHPKKSEEMSLNLNENVYNMKRMS
jgi:hypothetical protein